MQPDCLFPSVEVASEPPPVLSTAPEPAAWVWLAILVTVVFFEGWAVFTHHHTLSQWLWRHPFAKWLGVAGLVGFIVHILL